MTAAAAVADPATSPAPFSPRTVALMVMVGVLAFSALLALLAYGPDFRGGNNGEANALSRSAVGFAGVAEALRLAGDPVVVNRAAIRAGRNRGLLIVTPTPATEKPAVEALTFSGPVLVVLPKWFTVADLAHRGWVAKVEPLDVRTLPAGSMLAQAQIRRRPGVARATLIAVAEPFPAGVGVRAGPVTALQSIGAPGWIPVLTDQTGAVVLARDPHRPLYLLSDPDLLDNQGLKSIDTLGAALFILRGLRAADGPLIFDVRLNGLGRERSVLRLLFDPPFLGVTLCLAAAALLAGIQAFCRFGPVAREGRVIALGKTALVDNTAALIRLAGREPRMGGRYAELTADLTARSVGAPRSLGGDALTVFLDRLGARRRLPDALAELGVEARMARTVERLLSAAQRLYAWRIGLTGRDAPPGSTAELDRSVPSGLRDVQTP